MLQPIAMLVGKKGAAQQSKQTLTTGRQPALGAEPLLHQDFASLFEGKAKRARQTAPDLEGVVKPTLSTRLGRSLPEQSLQAFEDFQAPSAEEEEASSQAESEPADDGAEQPAMALPLPIVVDRAETDAPRTLAPVATAANEAVLTAVEPAPEPQQELVPDVQQLDATEPAPQAPELATPMEPPVSTGDAVKPAEARLPAADIGREVQVVSVRTYSPPVSIESVTVVVQSVADQAPGEPAAVSASPPVAAASPPIPEVRHLKIKLHPEHLGELTVSLKLNGDELAVKIEAHTGAALELIGKDETMLRKALQSAGYDSPVLTITAAQSANAPTPATPSENASGHFHSAAGGGQGGDAPPSRQNGAPRHFTQSEQDWRESDDRENAAAFADRRSDGIFL